MIVASYVHAFDREGKLKIKIMLNNKINIYLQNFIINSFEYLKLFVKNQFQIYEIEIQNIFIKVEGFPENLDGAAEDTVFDLKLVKSEAKIARVKNAVVEWGMPESLGDFFWKIYNYAKGDAKSKVWIFPGKCLASHNIKALSILLRYLVGILFLALSFKFTYLFPIVLFFLFLYLFWSFRKVLIEFGDWRVALWGSILQITSDTAVIYGFISGILGG